NHYKQWKKDANYFFGGVLDPSKKALRRSAKKAVFGPFEVLVDNTLYGRDLTKKSDGQIGGVQNIIISDPEYSDLRALETHKINDLEDMIMISKFFQFRGAMIEE
ncbi:10945_t:CDS:2, partial [Paraglomus occultum]